MKTRKTRRNRRGFTLVELIVVIAILAILAGIAIPVYSGYIKKANEASDLQQLDAIKTAAVYAYTEARVNAGETDVKVTYIKYVSGQTVDVNTSTGLDISAYTEGVTFKSETYQNGAEWSATTNAWAGLDAPQNNGGGEGGGEGG